MTIYSYLKPTSKNLLGEDMPKEKLEDKFLTPTKFSQEIERLVKKSNGLITYIEAVVTYCQENEIEVETVPKLISKPLKERLRHEAQRLNYMKASSKGVLPL
ncbi:late promoter transcription accessory protein [Prochlorococcus phage P-RSM4]|uniref:Late promoter transcription accessory protein n=2 Tax=Thaumasvirus stim4 TaxID=2734148 RepID=E3SMC6_9CAUD|nr:late promoter transcriptional regulator [Prochlorococcus phage P-RSM4]ADO98624.1 late promoter transcription accessory protein [Prochlorococcus phage P-RSM4]